MVELLSPDGAGNGMKPANEPADVTGGTGQAGITPPAKATAARKAETTTSTRASSRSTSPTSPTPSANDMAAPKSNDKENSRIADARAKNLDLAISQIQKDFGEAAIMRLGTDTRMDVEVIPTGNLIIDRALGAGGFPRGRIVEVFGPESSGKTTLTLTDIAQAQKMWGLAAFLELDHAHDPH